MGWAFPLACSGKPPCFLSQGDLHLMEPTPAVTASQGGPFGSVNSAKQELGFFAFSLIDSLIAFQPGSDLG